MACRHERSASVCTREGRRGPLDLGRDVRRRRRRGVKPVTGQEGREGGLLLSPCGPLAARPRPVRGPRHRMRREALLGRPCRHPRRPLVADARHPAATSGSPRQRDIDDTWLFGEGPSAIRGDLGGAALRGAEPGLLSPSRAHRAAPYPRFGGCDDLPLGGLRRSPVRPSYPVGLGERARQRTALGHRARRRRGAEYDWRRRLRATRTVTRGGPPSRKQSPVGKRGERRLRSGRARAPRQSVSKSRAASSADAGFLLMRVLSSS